MTLDEYLTAARPKGIREADFAETVGATQGHINRLRNGKGQPSLSLLLKITAATGGRVKAGDFAKREEAAA